MADYQVTFTLNPLYTGTTEADNFTIVGNPGNVTIATGVTKATLTTGVTYTVVDTITGGTITSTGTCTNSVNWTGYSAATPTPTETIRPTATPGPTLNTYYISTAVLGDSASAGATFCETSYLANTLVRSQAINIPGMLGFPIYDSNGDPLVLGAGRYVFVSETQSTSSSQSPDPRYIIECNLGNVEDVAQLDCSGGGGNPL